MSEILERAKRIQCQVAGDTTIHINLSFLQELIAEIERLEYALSTENVTAKLKVVP